MDVFLYTSEARKKRKDNREKRIVNEEKPQAFQQ
jgi:hypothetical protein